MTSALHQPADSFNSRKPRVVKVRPIRIDGDVAYVTLTKGKVAVIDASMLHMVESWNWCESTGYAQRCAPTVDGKWRTIKMHRILTNAPDGMQVDHIDGDKLNNRMGNLRICTNAQNQANRGAKINNTSGYKGVTAHGKAWQAQIMVDRRTIFLGTRDTPSEAHALYVAAAHKYHGQFARTE